MLPETTTGTADTQVYVTYVTYSVGNTATSLSGDSVIVHGHGWAPFGANDIAASWSPRRHSLEFVPESRHREYFPGPNRLPQTPSLMPRGVRPRCRCPIAHRLARNKARVRE